MKPEEFKLEYLDNYCESGGGFAYHSRDNCPSPSVYLEFSRDDLEEGKGVRSWVNSVGNSKRALHLQVELICDVFGWSSIYKKKQTPFPTRLEFLSKCGIISPAILAKLNKNRNKIEHEYYFPSQSEAEDYADIVELFMMATKNFIERFPEEIHYELMEDEEYDKSLNLPQQIEVETAIITGGLKLSWGDEILTKAIDEDDYFEWLSAIMNQYQL